MKTQAWGWLATAVLAAGLNSSYHNGGLQWIHEASDRVELNSKAVLALATGHADRFLAEAQLVSAKASPSCPVRAALAAIRSSIAPIHNEQERLEEMSAREEETMARLESRRTRMEARMIRLNVASFNPVVVRMPRITCPPVHVSAPHIPAMRMPVIRVPSAPVVHVDFAGAGPV